MKNPTIEDIERVMRGLILRRGMKEVAQDIHALFNPPMKPLSELAHNNEDQGKIFNYLFPDAQLYDISIWSDSIEMVGDDESGSVVVVINQRMASLSDFIRSLGYEPNPTK